MVDEADISTFRESRCNPTSAQETSQIQYDGRCTFVAIQGVVPSEEIKKRVGEPSLHPHGTVRLEAHADTNPIRPAEQRYMQEHGSVAYTQLLVPLFDELFPAN
jgi:hypothetical protein